MYFLISGSNNFFDKWWRVCCHFAGEDCNAKISIARTSTVWAVRHWLCKINKLYRTKYFIPRNALSVANSPRTRKDYEKLYLRVWLPLISKNMVQNTPKIGSEQTLGYDYSRYKQNFKILSVIFCKGELPKGNFESEINFVWKVCELIVFLLLCSVVDQHWLVCQNHYHESKG